MLFYPSKTNDKLNRKWFQPETINGLVMLNPKYPIRNIAPHTQVMMDSGAFQDMDNAMRLLPWTALERQLRYERVLQEHNPHFTHCEAMVIYDQMAGVDEAIINGKKVKIRGTMESAARAVHDTLWAAQIYAARRNYIQGHICFVGQGINPDQYINDCLIPMLDYMQKDDWFAFGGFCIIGRVPSLKPVFIETFDRALPLLRAHGVMRVHLLGVTVVDMVTYATNAAQRAGMVLSGDSSGPEVNGCSFGKQFIDGVWKPSYKKEDKFITYHPTDLALQNIKDYHQWTQTLS